MISMQAIVSRYTIIQEAACADVEPDKQATTM